MLSLINAYIHTIWHSMEQLLISPKLAIQSVSTSITLCDPLMISHSAFLVIYAWYCQFLNSNLCSAAKQAYLKMISYSLLLTPTLIFRVFSIILYGLKISFHLIIIFPNYKPFILWLWFRFKLLLSKVNPIVCNML